MATIWSMGAASGSRAFGDARAGRDRVERRRRVALAPERRARGGEDRAARGLDVLRAERSVRGRSRRHARSMPTAAVGGWDAVVVIGYRARMKVARIVWQGVTVHGIVDAEAGTIAPLDASVDLFSALSGAGRPGAPVPLGEVRLLAPLEPPSFRDFITFEEHIEGPSLARGGIPDTWYEIPTFYFTSVAAVTGTGEDIPVPPGCERFDFECELAAVIGRDGGDLTPEQ